VGAILPAHPDSLALSALNSDTLAVRSGLGVGEGGLPDRWGGMVANLVMASAGWH
jgi:hypothetical protein